MHKGRQQTGAPSQPQATLMPIPSFFKDTHLSLDGRGQERILILFLSLVLAPKPFAAALAAPLPLAAAATTAAQGALAAA